MSTIADLFRIEPEGRVRLGLGDVVDADGELAVWRGRQAFVIALTNVAGERIADIMRASFSLWVRVLPSHIIGDDVEVTCTAAEAREYAHLLYGDVFQQLAPLSLAVPWLTEYFIDTLPAAMDSIAETPSGPKAGEGPLPVGLSAHSLEQALSEKLRAPGPRMFFAGTEYPDHGDTTYWPLDPFPEDPETGDYYGLDFDWNPGVESRKANEDRAVAQFLHFYRAAQDRRLEEAQKRYPKKSRGKLYDHFVWLVQFQVLEWSYSKVARKANRSRPAVTEAIRDTAALIDLPLRDA